MWIRTKAPGRGARCRICGKTIPRGQIEKAIRFPMGSDLYVHKTCLEWAISVDDSWSQRGEMPDVHLR